MAAGQRPTAKQRGILRANGLDASNWLVLKNLSDRMVVKHRFLGSERTVFK